MSQQTQEESDALSAPEDGEEILDRLPGDSAAEAAESAEIRCRVSLGRPDGEPEDRERPRITCRDCRAGVVTDEYKGDTVIRCGNCEAILFRPLSSDDG